MWHDAQSCDDLRKVFCFGLQAGRVLHGVGGDLVILERTVDLALLAELEVPGVRRLEKVLEVRAVIGRGCSCGCIRWQIRQLTPSRARAPYFALPWPGCRGRQSRECGRPRRFPPGWSMANWRLPIDP